MSRIKKNIFIILIVAFIVVGFVLKDDFFGILDILFNLNKFYIFLAIIMFLIGDAFKGISITNIIKEKSKEYKYKRGFLLIIMTNFFNGITPFSLGGQPFQLYFLKKKENIDYVTGANILFKDFYTYQMALVILSSICLIISYIMQISIFNSVIRKLIWIGFAINFLISLFLLYIPYSKKNGKIVVSCLVTLLCKVKIIKDKEKKIEALNDYIQNFKNQINKIIVTPKLIISSILLNALKLISLGFTVYFCFRSLGAHVPLISSVVISILIITMSSFVPVPGGSGGMEFGFVALFSYYVIDTKLGAALLLWRFVTYYLPMLCGGIVTAVENRK